MDTKITDYITTETVMNAFSGAKDLAQAGAAATVEYYWASALIESVAPLCIPAILFFVFKAVNRVHHANLLKREEGLFSTDYIDSGAARLVTFIALLFSIMICIVSICSNVPKVVSPEGALIYDIVTGAAR